MTDMAIWPVVVTAMSDKLQFVVLSTGKGSPTKLELVGYVDINARNDKLKFVGL
jgi:hypothetical protein